MEKKMLVNGMMCVRCKARVEKALAEVPGVSACTVDLDSKTAAITLSQDVADAVLMKAVQDKGYTPVKML